MKKVYQERLKLTTRKLVSLALKQLKKQVDSLIDKSVNHLIWKCFFSSDLHVEWQTLVENNWSTIQMIFFSYSNVSTYIFCDSQEAYDVSIYTKLEQKIS